MSGIQIPGLIFKQPSPHDYDKSDLQRLAIYISRKHDVGNLRERARQDNIVKARVDFTRHARLLKFTYQQIGDYLGIHHTTVVHYMKHNWKPHSTRQFNKNELYRL